MLPFSIAVLTALKQIEIPPSILFKVHFLSLGYSLTFQCWPFCFSLFPVSLTPVLIDFIPFLTSFPLKKIKCSPKHIGPQLILQLVLPSYCFIRSLLQVNWPCSFHLYKHIHSQTKQTQFKQIDIFLHSLVTKFKISLSLYQKFLANPYLYQLYSISFSLEAISVLMDIFLTIIFSLKPTIDSILSFPQVTVLKKKNANKKNVFMGHVLGSYNE